MVFDFSMLALFLFELLHAVSVCMRVGLQKTHTEPRFRSWRLYKKHVGTPMGKLPKYVRVYHVIYSSFFHQRTALMSTLYPCECSGLNKREGSRSASRSLRAASASGHATRANIWSTCSLYSLLALVISGVQAHFIYVCVTCTLYTYHIG